MDINDIIKYEEGNMSREEEIKFFQHLVDTGIAFQLQGHYGRTAMYWIEEGSVHVRKD